MTHDNLPENVRVVYTPKCNDAGSAGDGEGVCDNVRVGQEVSSVCIFILCFTFHGDVYIHMHIVLVTSI